MKTSQLEHGQLGLLLKMKTCGLLVDKEVGQDVDENDFRHGSHVRPSAKTRNDSGDTDVGHDDLRVMAVLEED